MILDTISRNGGHLGAAMGAVELAVALHYVFESPKDRIIWDVGHQAHAHKILTGRRDLFPTIKQEGGISGFLKRSESPHDVFGAGHASTSISAALGIREALRLKDGQGKVVALIGDGGLMTVMLDTHEIHVHPRQPFASTDTVFPQGRPSPDYREHTVERATEYTAYGHQGDARALEELLDCIESGATPTADGRVGRDCTVLGLAAEHSIETGRIVELDATENSDA